jgi:GT2 family glycosyltransferase
MRTRIVLFDDNCTDGTSEGVLSEAPDAVIVQGDGTAFWNGGLYQAWKRALELDVDGFLWLNDDVALDYGALDRLGAYWRDLVGHGRTEFVLVGATRGSNGELTYGGMRRRWHPLALKLDRQPVSEALLPVDTFNGNIVLVPRTVTDKIGINDPAYYHKFGDVDYGLTATAAGIPSYVLPGTLGVCDSNEAPDMKGLRLAQRWNFVNSHRGLPMAGWWRLVRRHSGPWFLPHFLTAYKNLLKPW